MHYYIASLSMEEVMPQFMGENHPAICIAFVGGDVYRLFHHNLIILKICMSWIYKIFVRFNY